MALKERFRRAMGRSDDNDRSSISSSSTGKNTGTTTPTNGEETLSPLSTIKTAVDTSKPNITLTKTTSRLGKTLTWHSSNPDKKSKQELAKEKQLKQWAKSDDVEWTSPMSRRPGKKDQNCQNTLRAFDFRQAALGTGARNKSVCSGVSPSGSRANSIDGGLAANTKRHSSGAVGPGKLSQELRREEEKPLETHIPHMVGVREE